MSSDRKIILVTGASGYIGGRLVNELRTKGHKIRCMVRNPEFLKARVPGDIDVVYGDILDKKSLIEALHGVHSAYYLIHAMGEGGNFEEADRTGSRNFAKAAREAGLKRLIYLGGLGDSQMDLSQHLRSRQEVGRILADSGVQTIELRASIVIGSGSLSFELIRALVERLPIMVTPRWVSIKAQPIAITDLLNYLMDSLVIKVDGNHIYEIGGSDCVSYADLMREFASQRGLKRLMIAVPVLTPRLSSLWLGLVTPIYARIGRKLIDSLRHETIINNHSALKVFKIQPRGYRKAIEEALKNEDKEIADSRWFDSLSSSGARKNWANARFGNRLVDLRQAVVKSSGEAAFHAIQRIGGKNGWYYADWLWDLRGFIDLVLGGVGMRRARRHPEEIRIGDTIDWWRVEAYEPNRRLRLVSEMKLPGRAWLEFQVKGNQSSSLVRQIAVFDPIGLRGLAYWYLIYPIHVLIFRGMFRAITRRVGEVKIQSEDPVSSRLG